MMPTNRLVLSPLLLLISALLVLGQTVPGPSGVNDRLVTTPEENDAAIDESPVTSTEVLLDDINTATSTTESGKSEATITTTIDSIVVPSNVGDSLNDSVSKVTTNDQSSTELPVTNNQDEDGETEEEEEEDDASGTSAGGDGNGTETTTESSAEEDDEYYEEERCSFNQFLSGLNISHYLPKDREDLRLEFDLLQDSPERIRHSPSVNYTIQRLKRLLNLANGITSRPELRSGMASFIQHNYDLFLELELDAPCMTSLISIIAGIRRSELWAMKYSMAKPPAGLLSGVTSFLGDFDQCLSITSPESAPEEFNGQYCVLRPILPVPEIRRYLGQSDEELMQETKIISFLANYQVDQYVHTNPVLKFIEHIKSIKGRVLNFGLCVPDLCAPKQLEKSFNRMLYPIVGIPFEIQNSSCWTLEKTRSHSQYMNQYAQFAIVVLSVVGVLVVSSTIYDLYCNSLGGDEWANTSRLVTCLVSVFSARHNTIHLVESSPSRLAILDNLRLAIIILIGLCNTFYNTPQSGALNKMTESAPYELLSDPRYFFIRAPSLLNDGLLIIAGALFLRSLFHHLDQPHDMFSYILYVLRRWLRITAPLFGSILFIFLLPLTGYGPLWDRMVEILMPACNSPSSLTSTFLYYSNWNFVKSNHSNANSYVVCNPDTWFLSIIFQLNLAFFMIVLLVYQSPRNGLRLLVLFIMSSIVFNLSPRIFHSNTRTYYELTKQPSMWHLRRNFYLYHQNIIQYIGAFSVGLLLGYAIIVNDNKKSSSSSPKRSVAYNLVALSSIVALFVWINHFFVQNSSPSETSVLLFFSLGRLTFSLAFAWLIYACISKRSVWLESILTWPSLQPIAKLSFSIFLVQNLVQYHRMYSIKDTYVMTFRSTIENYIIDFFISTTLGYALYLMFEGPVHRLNEYFTGKSDYYEDNLKCAFSPEKRNDKHPTAPGGLYDTNRNSENSILEYPRFPTAATDTSKGEFYENNGIITIRF